MENGAASDGKDPSGFLSEIIGAPVTVKLNSGVVYKGKRPIYHSRVIQTSNSHVSGELQSVDGYMNIALEKTEEYVDGKLRRNYGDAFVRGNNGTMIWEFSCCLLGILWLTAFTVMYISSDS